MNSFSQDYSQTVKGRIVDKESNYPLLGTTVAIVTDSSNILSTTANEDGYFRLDNVPFGRHIIFVSLLGYKSQTFDNILVDAGKQTILNVKLEEQTSEIGEVEVIGYAKDGTVNEMALISSRTFRADETERYAGSRQDPARMASNFAGVQGTDDSRNDIVIRGNTPLGLLWRVEDIDIPSPNHFSVAGSTGSPISVLNNKTIGTSDFMTGAFSADYGNATAGVFDLKLRNGNSEKREFSGQFGLFGTELMAEGPISKKSGSSYLLAYRYSTFTIFNALNINLGTSSVPKYQDLTFKLNFPTKKSGVFSIWGIGGLSSIDIIMSKFTDPDDPDYQEIYGLKDRDQFFRTNMGVIGFSHAYPINKKTFSKLSVAQSGSLIWSRHDQIVRDTSWAITKMYLKQGYWMKESKTSLHYYINHKLNPRNTIKIGVIGNRNSYAFQDSILTDTFSNFWLHRLDYDKASFMFQPYVSLKTHLTDKLTMVAGLHGMIFTINSNSKALDPRLSFQYELKNNQNISLGLGIHSQKQVSYIYGQQVLSDTSNNYHLLNDHLGFTRSFHVVGGYNKRFNANLRLKAEAYYQYLFKLPVDVESSSYAIINQGSGFDRFFPDSLKNTGNGQNMGIELTLEKFFSKNYFFMLTGSLFDSKYTASDGQVRNSDFNGNFATNILFGYEKSIGKKKKNAFNTGVKLTWAGGRRYTPVDVDSSKVSGYAVYLNDERNTLQFPNYFRIDYKIGIKFNGKKAKHEIAIDILNLTDRVNILAKVYDPDQAILHPNDNPVIDQPQLARIPVFYYKVDF